MQFKLSVDESTQLGTMLAALPPRNRQSRLIELATFGLLVSSGSVTGLGFSAATAVRLEDQLMVHPKEPTVTSVNSSAPAVSLSVENGTVDFGDLPDI